MKKIKTLFLTLVISIGLVNSFALKPKVIIFDAADTLIKVDKNYSLLLDKAVQAKGWEIKSDSKKVLYEVIQRHPKFFEIAENVYDKKKRVNDIPDWIKIIEDWCKTIGYSYDDENVKDLLQKIISIGSSVDSPFILGLFPKVDETLKQLKLAGYRLALLSNWNSSLRDLLKKYNIESYFEVITISSEVGFNKPNIEIFKKALNDLNVLKDDVIYVGDTLSDDIYGAKNVGIQPVWANYKGQAVPENLFDLVTISSIDDLLNKVDM